MSPPSGRVPMSGSVRILAVALIAERAAAGQTSGTAESGTDQTRVRLRPKTAPPTSAPGKTKRK